MLCGNDLQVLSLKQGGLLWGGVPCSSFVWLNMGTSRRCKDHVYLALCVFTCRPLLGLIDWWSAAVIESAVSGGDRISGGWR